MADENQAIPSAADAATWEQLDREIGETGEPLAQQMSDANAEIDQILAEGGAESDVSEKNAGREPPDSPQNTETEGDDGVQQEEKEESDQAGQEIDYSLEIPMPHEMGTMTVGELKDAVGNMHVQTERLNRDRAQLNQDRQLLQDIINAAGVENLSPQAKGAVDAYRERHITQETELMLRVIPEWEDNTVYQRDSGEMLQIAREFGFTPEEFAGVTDHRLVHWMRSHALERRRNREAREKMEQARQRQPQVKPGRKTRKPNTAAQIDKMVRHAAASDDAAVKDAAINKLLE